MGMVATGVSAEATGLRLIIVTQPCPSLNPLTCLRKALPISREGPWKKNTIKGVKLWCPDHNRFNNFVKYSSNVLFVKMTSYNSKLSFFPREWLHWELYIQGCSESFHYQSEVGPFSLLLWKQTWWGWMRLRPHSPAGLPKQMYSFLQSLHFQLHNFAMLLYPSYYSFTVFLLIDPHYLFIKLLR